MARIEIDKDTLHVLDEIKKEKWDLAGRGHSDTVRFLAQYYRQHGAIEKIIDERLKEIPGIVGGSFKSALATAVCNLLDIRVDRIAQDLEEKDLLKGQ